MVFLVLFCDGFEELFLSPTLILLSFFEKFCKLLALFGLVGKVSRFYVGLLLFVERFDGHWGSKGKLMDSAEGNLFAMIIVLGLSNQQTSFHYGDMPLIVKQRVVDNFFWFVVIGLAHLPILPR